LQTLANYQVIDLSHTLEEGIPSYPTHPKYFLGAWNEVDKVADLNMIVMSDHTGTHMDSTNHFILDENNPVRKSIDEIGPLFGRAITVKVGPYESTNQVVSKSQIIQWEHDNNIVIKEDDIVIINFQWGKKWVTGPKGDEFVKGWPGLAEDAVAYLVEKKIKAVGTDCLSIDPGDGSEGQFNAHYGFLGNGIVIIENLANLDQIPSESYFMALPLKFKNGTASPIRPIALVPNEGGEADSSCSR
jgi:arylformamidase